MTHYLASLTTESTDDEIARAVAAHVLGAFYNPHGPVRLAYRVDGPQPDAPPPVRCDRVVKRDPLHQSCTLYAVERDDHEWCREWLLEVLKKGLYVQRFIGVGFYTPIVGSSIKATREMLASRQRLAEYDATRVAPAGYLDKDDDIPF